MNLAMPALRRSLARAIAAATLLAAAPSFAQPAAPGDSLESLLAYARERHPELRAMRYEADAAAQRVDPAGANTLQKRHLPAIFAWAAPPHNLHRS